jgi:hypothetical protein
MSVFAIIFAGSAIPAAAGFANRKVITVAGSRVVGGPHTDFPVLLAVVDAELRLSPLGGVRGAQGCDITFRDSDGVTPLAYEIRSYDPASGMLAAYVRLPSIQNGVDTQFYLYYGDPEVACRQTRHGDVWDAGYRGVFHLAETSGNPVDSTSNGVAGRFNPQGDAGVVVGQAGDALELITPPTTPPGTFIPTTDSFLQLADGTLSGNSSFTLEAWFLYHPVNAGQYIGLVTKNRDGCNFPCDQPGEDWVGLFKNDGDTLTLGMDTEGGPGNLDGATTLVADQWYYGAVAYGAGGRRVHLYDTIDAQSAVAGSYTDLALPSRVGDDSNGNYLSGFIGEVRVSTVERSPEWLYTSARNQGCPTASVPPPSCVAPYPASLRIPFLTVGAAQADR